MLNQDFHNPGYVIEDIEYFEEPPTNAEITLRIGSKLYAGLAVIPSFLSGKLQEYELSGEGGGVSIAFENNVIIMSRLDDESIAKALEYYANHEGLYPYFTAID